MIAIVVINAIVDSVYQQEEEGTKKTLKVVAPLIDTSLVTTITEDDIDYFPVPVSDDAITFTDHANNLQTHLTFTTSATTVKNRNKCEPKFYFSIQDKQYAVDNYYLFIDKLLTSNSSMETHYQVITTRHIQLIFNQSQADACQLSMKHKKEVYLGTCNYHLQTFHPLSNPETDVIQYQDAFNNILITIWSDGLFKVIF